MRRTCRKEAAVVAPRLNVALAAQPPEAEGGRQKAVGRKQGAAVKGRVLSGRAFQPAGPGISAISAPLGASRVEPQFGICRWRTKHLEAQKMFSSLCEIRSRNVQILCIDLSRRSAYFLKPPFECLLPTPDPRKEYQNDLT